MHLRILWLMTYYRGQLIFANEISPMISDEFLDYKNFGVVTSPQFYDCFAD